MNAGVAAKILFWAAICISSIWLAFAGLVGFLALYHFFTGGFSWAGHSALEILIVVAFALQPFAILWLIVRAIRRRIDGRGPSIIARALYPLALTILLVGYPKAFEYIFSKFEMRMELQSMTGSMTYKCSQNSDAHTVRLEFSLLERRHPRQLSSWTVIQPGKKPIPATSFQAKTGSIGGSQGIAWKDSDGRSLVAYLLFSDIVSSPYGPTGILVVLSQSGVKEIAPDLSALRSKNFYCKPDSASYRD